MKVYYAPNTRAVRTVWLLNELGLDYELERFTLGEKAMRAPEYLAVNPNGRVPTLDDGEVRMSESTAIAQYLVARYGDGSLARSPDSPEFPAYLQWLHYAEGMIMPPINAYVVETILLPPERRSETHADRALRLLNRTLGPVEARLEGRDYLLDSFSAADTITGHACIMSEKFGVDFADKPNLKAYNERLLARPALQTAWDA
ncbi:MAG: glutathione S-transferase family protein [Defluviicoccus sp.]|nr:glutathione S-transferase family protein [Defluviicoccus sp.]